MNGRENKSQSEVAQPACHRGSRTGPAPLLLLCHGVDDGGDQSAVHWRGDLLGAAPCNIALMRQAQAVKKGVAVAGGTPREFCTITVTDGIAMGHEGMKSSLPSREVIADSVELTMRGHSYDALVGMAGCDKSLPGMMMAMCRLNVPAIFIYGGSILPGTFKGKPVTVQDVFEAVGKHSVGEMSDDDLEILEQNACPSAARAALSSPRTPWRPSPRRSGWPCPIRRARPRLTNCATGSA